MATIDHLYSRLHPRRELHHREQKNVFMVLACRQCNNERAAAENKGQTFTPKLPEKQEYADKACAVKARTRPVDEPIQVEHRVSELAPPRRVIQTIEEAIAFAQEHPER